MIFSNKQYNFYNKLSRRAFFDEKCHVHSVYGAGIGTHNRLSMSRLRKPLDQGSCLVLANGFLQGNAN